MLLIHLASEFHHSPNLPISNHKILKNILHQIFQLFDLNSGIKSESNPHILKDDFRGLQIRHKNYQQVYTDGSKEDSKVGCAVISGNHSNMQRIPDDSSIFTAEAYLLQVEEQPKCVGCDAPFTVRHFLLECGDFAQVKNNCFYVDNMKQLFLDIHIDSIMTF